MQTSAMEPWVGSTYRMELVRMLILGESEYAWWKPGYSFKTVATGLINDLLEKNWTHKFYTNIFQMVTGKRKADTPKEDIRKFWHSVAFYNYVQTPVGSTPRVRPTKAMWEESKEPFCAVFDDLKPHAAVILGAALGYNLSDQRLLRRAEGCIALTSPVLSGSSHQCPACVVYHPSSGRFSSTRWHQSVKQLLEEVAKQGG